MNEPSPQVLFSMFQEFPYRTNPLEAPMCVALRRAGHTVVNHPVFSEYSTQDWLAAKVRWRSLQITLRQPTPRDVLLCRIERAESRQGIASPLLDIARFVLFARETVAGMRFFGGCTSKRQEASPGDLRISRLLTFYQEGLGDLQHYEYLGQVWLFGDCRREARYALPVWRRAARDRTDKAIS